MQLLRQGYTSRFARSRHSGKDRLLAGPFLAQNCFIFLIYLPFQKPSLIKPKTRYLQFQIVEMTRVDNYTRSFGNDLTAGQSGGPARHLRWNEQALDRRIACDECLNGIINQED